MTGVEEDSYCFLCGAPLGTLPFVMWVGHHPGHGDSFPIAFHPRCAVSFHLRFGRDCWEVEGFLDLLDLHGESRP